MINYKNMYIDLQSALQLHEVREDERANEYITAVMDVLWYALSKEERDQAYVAGEQLAKELADE